MIGPWWTVARWMITKPTCFTVKITWLTTPEIFIYSSLLKYFTAYVHDKTASKYWKRKQVILAHITQGAALNNPQMISRLSRTMPLNVVKFAKGAVDRYYCRLERFHLYIRSENMLFEVMLLSQICHFSAMKTISITCSWPEFSCPLKRTLHSKLALGFF